MIPATEHRNDTLTIRSIAKNPHAGKWRTEAMRSHSTPRLIFFSKGQGRITVAGLTRGYGPNNLIFIPAHTMYGYDVGQTVFGQILTIPSAMAPEWPDEHINLRLRDVVVQKEFVSLIDGLERELGSNLESSKRAAHYRLGLISVFFERQVEQNNASLGKVGSDSSAARLVAAYTDLIERDYRLDLGVAEFAGVLGVTPTPLTRCCKVTCNRSALELLNDRRHYEACMLLRETDRSVMSISKDLGFSSPAYFSRAFQNRAGRSPSKFRRFGAV